MSKKLWSSEYEEITDVIDRLANVGNKLKNTSGKLKVQTISNRQDFKDADYRKAVANTLIGLCRKYKKRIDLILNLCELRVKSILESNTDIIKQEHLAKTTWCESLNLNVPSHISLQRFTCCQVSVNRICGNRLRKYKLYSNERQIKSNVTSPEVEPIAVLHKHKKLKLSKNHSSNKKTKTPTESGCDEQSKISIADKNNDISYEGSETDSSSLRPKSHFSNKTIHPKNNDDLLPSLLEDTNVSKAGNKNIVEVDGFHDKNSDQEYSASEKPAVQDSCEHLDRDSERKNDVIRVQQSNDSTAKTISPSEKSSESLIDTGSNKCNTGNIFSESIDCLDKHCDKETFDIEMADIRLTISSVNHSDNVRDGSSSTHSDGSKTLNETMSKTKVLEYECSEAHSNEITRALSNEGIVEFEKVFEDDANLDTLKNERHKHKINLIKRKNQTLVAIEDIHKKTVSSAHNSDGEVDHNISLLKEIHELSKEPKLLSQKANFSINEDAGIGNENNDAKSVSYKSKRNEDNYDFLTREIPKPENKKTVVFSDKDEGLHNEVDDKKSVSSKSEQENDPDSCLDQIITEHYKKNNNSNNESSDGEEKSMASKLKSDSKNNPGFFKKRKSVKRNADILIDKDGEITNHSGNGNAGSSKSKRDEDSEPDNSLDKVIPELSENIKLQLNTKRAIVFSDDDENTVSPKSKNNDKVISEAPKPITNKNGEINDDSVGGKSDEVILEFSKHDNTKSKSKTDIVQSDENDSDDGKSKPKGIQENRPNKNTFSKQSKPRPRREKIFSSNEKDTSATEKSDSERFMSKNQIGNEGNEPLKYSENEIPKYSKQNKPKSKSKDCIVSRKEETSTKININNAVFSKCDKDPHSCLIENNAENFKQHTLQLSNETSVSCGENAEIENDSNGGTMSLPKSSLGKESTEFSDEKCIKHCKQGKPKSIISKKSTVSSKASGSAMDFVDSDERKTDEVSEFEGEATVKNVARCNKTDVSSDKDLDSIPRQKFKHMEDIGLGNESSTGSKTDCEDAKSDRQTDEEPSLDQDISTQNTEMSGNADAPYSSYKQDKYITSSQRTTDWQEEKNINSKKESSKDDKTMNDSADGENVLSDTDNKGLSENKTRTNKTNKISGLNNETELAKSMNDQKHEKHIISATPDDLKANTDIEEIILSDTDSEADCVSEEKVNNDEKIFLKCVDISKLTGKITDKPSNNDDEKREATTKKKHSMSPEKKGTHNKKTSALRNRVCKPVKSLVKLREFSVKVCRMSTFNENFLKKHELKVIKKYDTKEVVVELKQAERNARAKNELLGDSSSSASPGRNGEANTTKSPISSRKRKRQRRVMRARERLMSVSSTDTEEELVQNALNKIKMELRISQTKQSPNKRSPGKRFSYKVSPSKKRKLFISSKSSSSGTDDMVRKALAKVSKQIKNEKSRTSKSGDSSDTMGRSLRRNRGKAQTSEQENTDQEDKNSTDSAIENLANLKNIKKTERSRPGTDSSEDGHQTKKLKMKPNTEVEKSDSKSDSEDEVEIPMDLNSNEDISTIEDEEDSLLDMPKSSRSNGKSNADMAKQELLRDSGDTSATDKGDDDDKSHKNVKKEELSSADEEEEKKKSNGRNSGKKTRTRSDRLLRGKLDLTSSNDERDSSTSRSKKRKPKVDSDEDGSDYENARSDSESDDSKDFKRTAKRKPMTTKKSSDKESDDSSKSSGDGNTKKKRRRIKVIADSDASGNSGSGSESEGGKKSGRKNIRKVIRKDQLEEATKKAAREERERVARIQERQKAYNSTAFDESGKPDEVVLDKVVLDFDPETKEPLISVDPGLVKKLKPHQANGIKFMWDACFESVKQIKKGKGSGCILAHCMGLGKTLQVVSLAHTLLAHWELTKVTRILVVCPLSTVLNWVNEFRMWLKLAHNDIDLNIFELSKFKQNNERSYQMEEWMECGGICVLGYEMFRNLSADNPKKFRKKMLKIFQESLVDPGPDLVVCDEGHLLKNEKTSLSQSMNRIKTIRRIVLTGTPLQNNLKEYYCMVQFVKPNLLGKYNEYLNRFVNPITNGQYTDSTDHDIRIMKRRSHVLHKMLDGAVQRRDYGVLAPFLPPKHEYIVFIALTELQITLYTYYLENLSRRPHPDRKTTSFLFPDFQSLQRIWTHPLVLKANSDRYEIMQQKKRDKEDEDEDSEGSLVHFIDDETTTEEETTEESSDDSGASDDSRPKKSKAKKKDKKHNKKIRSTRLNPEPIVEKEKEVEVVEQKSENWTEWWLPLVTEDQLEDMRHSNKLQLLFQILKECEAIGDKLLVFSQSLYSLDLIEHFLGKIDEATQSGQSEENLGGHIGSWSVGVDYFRLDGQTSCENRSIWCKSFNREDNPRARLFLISTRAGGLGINLVAANRVVIFDMSWNPSHDVQSIFRVYRFGQKKPCYIYRFLAMGTMEEKIYERQVTKQAISKRVIDEQQIDRHYAENDLAELYQFTPRPLQPREVPLVPKDRLFAEMLKSHEDAIYKYHEHDSLLENKEEETLTEEERKAAWDDFESEKNRPPPPPMTYNQNYNGFNNMMNQNSVALAAIANMLRRDYPQLTDQQMAAMIPSIMYQADPSLYGGGYDFNMMNSLINSQYANTAMQPNLMMNPGAGMSVAGAAGGALRVAGGPGVAGPTGSALRGALGGAMGGAPAYQPLWQQQQQMQLQRLMQQQQQMQKAQAGMKFYAGGLGSRDPISMALQQQKQREMILSGVGGVGSSTSSSSMPLRGRPPKPKPTLNNEVVTLDDSD